MIVVWDRGVEVVEIPVSSTKSRSCDVGWKFDDVVLFAIMDEI